MVKCYKFYQKLYGKNDQDCGLCHTNNVNKYSTTACYPRWVWVGVAEDGDGDGDEVEVSPGPCPVPRGHDPAIDILHSQILWWCNQSSL